MGVEAMLEGVDLVKAGKILYPAASNFAAWQVAKALGLSALHGWAPFKVLQPMYNLVKRQAEVEILPMALSEGLGVISYSPLGGGLLSGKSARRAPDPVACGQPRISAALRRRVGLRCGRRVHRLCPRRDTARQPGGGLQPPRITAPIIGARNLPTGRSPRPPYSDV
jgi:aryl-alcohol dehydrogenase-like predicted oxidoreductase